LITTDIIAHPPVFRPQPNVTQDSRRERAEAVAATMAEFRQHLHGGALWDPAGQRTPR
jgi:hypothetical protein